MNPVAINQDLDHFYKNQYKNESLEWRALGAKAKARNILQISAGLDNIQRVLELGAGDGSVLNEMALAKPNWELCALEISTSGLERINERKLSNLKEALLFDGYTIPYPDGHFDLVYMTHVLEHVEHERLLLRELKRVSKYQIIEVPREYRSRIDTKIDHFLAYGHINMYTPSLLKFLLRAEEFNVKKELLKSYDLAVLRYMGKGSLLKTAIHSLSWTFKQVMLALPFYSLREKYCSTITLLCESSSIA